MVSPSQPHLLVVDDEASIREALLFALKDSYVVHPAASGTEACAVLGRYPIVAIILDAILGEEHGLNLVPRFRRLSSAPIMLLTGHGSEELAARAIWADVDGYLMKPPSIRALHAALDRIVSREERPVDLPARARRALDEYPSKPFHAADLARQLGVGEAQLRRLFRAAYSQTPRQYLAEIRIRRAQGLLRTTDHGTKEVAQDVGFANLLALRRGFKRSLGVTPHASRTADLQRPAAD